MYAAVRAESTGGLPVLRRLRPRRGDERREDPPAIATAKSGPFGSWMPERTARTSDGSRPDARSVRPSDGDANVGGLSNAADRATTAQPESAASEPKLVAPEPAPSAPEPAPSPPEPSSRRTRAVQAYCRELCRSEQASAAATETLRSLAGEEENQLPRVTRIVAAKHVDTVDDPRGGWRRPPEVQRERECTLTPFVLAALGNDELGEAEKAKFDGHCDACVTCQAVELRWRRAERAFAAIMRMPVAAGAGAIGEVAGAAPERSTGPEAPIAPVTEPQAPQRPLTLTEAQPAPKARAHAASAWLPQELASSERRTTAVQSITPATGVAAGEPALLEPAAVTARREPGRSRRRRRSAVFGVATLVAAAAIAAAVLLTHGSSNTQPVSRTNVAARSSAATPVRHRAPNRAAATPRQHAAAHATNGATASAAASSGPSAAPSSAAAASVPSASPATSASAPAPAVSSPSPASNPPSSSSAPNPSSSQPSSPPGISIQQPSLGSANAPQGIGK